MSSNQIKVDLFFNANVQQAKNQVNQLATLLRDVQTPKNVSVQSTSVREAINAASELEMRLRQAVNVDTGKINISAFTAGLKKSNLDIMTLQQQLTTLGPKGQKAFIQLSHAVAAAEMPIRKTSGLVKNFLGTLGSAMLWSMAYSSINQVGQAFKNATSYITEMNKALTDISIVSNLTSKELEDFAKRAAEAAKELKTTSTEYAKAALIFYQQGLNSDEVEKRTATVIKLSQVTGQTAQTVSDQMTAIWNNFYDGSQTLEYYADALAALGATTAASTDEISKGLEKFAAVADTVGLSYEYASAAVTTLIDKTRQSPEVLGTALKTLFARIQDLDLGNTLDDGVSLGKYSEALDVVGVSILDVNGQMKDMDIILDDIGARWESLTSAQKTALAQTVAGIRQYSQFIALMDNYTSMQENVDTAKSSSGALSIQQMKWSDSIEAQKQEMSQSAKGLYDELLDEDTIKTFIKALSDVLKTVTNIIDNMGGIGPLLLVITGIFSKTLMPIVQNGINYIVQGFKTTMGLGDRQIKQTMLLTAAYNHQSESQMSKIGASLSMNQALSIESELTERLVMLKKDFTSATHRMTEAEQKEYEARMQNHEQMVKEAQALAEEVALTNQSANSKKSQLAGQTDFSTAKNANEQNISLKQNELNELQKQKAVMLKKHPNVASAPGSVPERKKWDQLTSAIKSAEQELQQYKQTQENILKLEKGNTKTVVGKLQGGTKESKLYLEKENGMSRDQEKEIDNINSLIDKSTRGMTDEVSLENVEKMIHKRSELRQVTQDLSSVQRDLNSLISLEGASTDSIQQSIIAADNLSAAKQKQAQASKEVQIAEQNLAKAMASGDKEAKKSAKSQLVTARKNFAAATKQVTSEEKNFSNATKNLNTVQQSAISSISNIKTQITSLGTQMGLTEAEVKELTNNFNDLSPSMLANGQGVKNLQQTLTNMIAASTASGDSFDDMADRMIKMLTGLGMSKDALMDWVNTLNLGDDQALALKNAIDQLTQSEERMKQQSKGLTIGMQDITSGIQSASMVFMSLNSLISVFNDEEAKMSQKISSLAMALPMLLTAIVPLIQSVTAAIRKNTAACMTNPIIAAAALILGIIAAVGAALASSSEKEEERARKAEQAKTEQAKSNLKLVETIRSETEALEDLIDSYDKLQAAGSSVYDTFEDLQAQGEALNEKYRDLARTLTTISWGDIARLEEAYQKGLATGDFTEYKKIAQEMEDKANQASWEDAKIAADDSESGIEAKGKEAAELLSGTTHSGEGVSYATISANAAVEDVETTQIKDLTNIGAVNDEIAKIEKAIENYKQKLKGVDPDSEAGQVYSQYLNNLQTYLTLLNEQILPTITNATQNTEEQNNLNTAALANFDQEFNVEQEKNPLSTTDYTSYEDYIANRAALIEDIISFWEGRIDENTAIAILKKSKYADLEKYYQLLGDENNQTKLLSDATVGGLIGTGNGQMTVAELGQWFQGLSATDENAAQWVDWTKISDKGQLEKALGEAKKKSNKYQAKTKADANLDIDNNTFDVYYEALKKLDPKLEEHEELLAEVTYQTLQLKASMDELADDWEETWQLIQSTDPAEQAEGYAAIQQAISEAYGFAIDTSKIQEASTYINEFLAGNYENYQKFLDIMATSYVMSLQLDDSQVVQYLEIINSGALDPSLEVGATVDDTALIAGLNSMIADSEETAKRIQQALSLKGWTFNYQIGNDGKISIVGGLTRSSSQGSFSGSFGSAKNKNSGGSKKDDKVLDKEKERYHEIDKELDTLNRKYDRISKAKDRAFGPQRLKYLDQEIKKTNELAETTKKKLAEAEQYLASDREKLAQYGASFDEYGNITNYDEMMALQVETFNNNKTDAQEEYFNQFKDDIAQYEETHSLAEDLKDELQDYGYQEQGLRMEKIQYEVEYKVRLADNDLKLLEYQIENLSDSVEDAAKKFALLGKSADSNIRKAEAATGGLKNILKEIGFTEEEIAEILKNPASISAMLEGKEITEEQMSALEGYVEELYDYSNELKDLYDQVSDSLVASFEDMNEEMDRSISQLEHFTSMIESFKSIIELAGEENLGISSELMLDMFETQKNIAKGQISVQKEQLKQNMAAAEALKAEMDLLDPDSEKYKELKEAYDEINEQVMEDQENYLATLETGLQAAADLFSKEMDVIFKEFEDAMTGAYGTFERLQAAYDQRKEKKDFYLDDYQKIYKLSKLNRDIINSIDESDNIRAKERLRDIQEEINALQESNVEMTQYEVDELRAKYDLRLAEIALEEAQNAKSQVRMSRDSEDNWSYVYTADENAVSDAEQNYEDKLYNYQNLVQDYTDEMMDRLMQIPQEYAEAVRAIYEDQTLSDEERQLAIEETQKHYQDMYNNVIKEMEKVNIDAANLYNQDWMKYSETTGYKISKDGEWVDSFKETIFAQTTGLLNLDQAQLDFKDATDTVLGKITEAYGKYQLEVKGILDLALGDIEKFLGDDSSGLKGYLKQAETAAGDEATKAKEFGEENKKAFEIAVLTASNLLGQYETKIQEWTSATESWASAINNIASSWTAVGEEIDKVKEKAENMPKADYVYDNSGNGNDSTVQNDSFNPRTLIGKKLKTKNKNTRIWRYKFDGASLKAIDKSSDPYNVENLSVIQVRKEGGEYYVNLGDNGKTLYGDEGWIKLSNFQGYDTGGYTGSWDASGRLAFLHQKELVLNAHDTANFLSAIDILRDITSIIDLQALSQSNMLSALTSAQIGAHAQVIEQEVTIHAEFPNATNHGEIEEAFNSLLTRASQFANRKN